jgi:hypothetical protein
MELNYIYMMTVRLMWEISYDRLWHQKAKRKNKTSAEGFVTKFLSHLRDSVGPPMVWSADKISRISHGMVP